MRRPREAGRPSIELRGIDKRFGDARALRGIDVAFPAEQTTVLIGPSGSGKSTLLNVIAGLIAPDAGAVFFGEHDITNVPPEKRGVGYVFQSYALFPHLNVEENIGFGVHGLPDERAIVQRQMQRLQIEHLARRRPRELSGGERQRVALARALAYDPGVLLLDEPLSALDPLLRESVRDDLVRVLHESRRTVIYVTHDRAEAMTVGDRVVVLEGGEVVQAGTPVEIYRMPRNAFVASFMGDANLLSATVDSSGLTAKTALGVFTLTAPAPPCASVLVLLRPEMFAAGAGDVQLEVVRSSFLGARWRVEGRVLGERIVVDVPGDTVITNPLPLMLNRQPVVWLAR
jgi:ABC-type Fe3+/spermidine/putrescine transport system ATPase subunit